MLFAILKFLLWEIAVGMAALRLARAVGWRGVDFWLGTLAMQVTLESSFAALLSFTGLNSPAAYWMVAFLCGSTGIPACVVWCKENHTGTNARATGKHAGAANRKSIVSIVCLTAPLLWLAFRPVEEIDSINYLHYLIDWMANRSTPYTFATNYVAFWELSFLPAWTVTGVDWFFPLLALKALALMALALWLAGRELALRPTVLLWTIFGALTMRHYWFEYSGVPTLKNDVLHGVGFVLLLLAVLRSSSRTFSRPDVVLLALGASFAAVKYTGIFLAVLAIGFLIARGLRSWVWVSGLFLITSGHYYLRSLILHGNPFYPFQINLAFVHLPGTADLSYTSILFHLHDPRLWRALFWPSGVVSPAGLLFPAILAGSLIAASWLCIRAVIRRRLTALDSMAIALLCGWLLYFRSVFSAGSGPTDLSFILNNLNSIRYVDGVLAASELFLAALLGRLAIPFLAVNLASRILMLYTKLSLQNAAFALVSLIPPRPAMILVPLAVILGCPLLVEYHRAQWTTYWDDLKPALAEVRASGLAELALEDGGYFAGHVVAAGNPVNPSVRALLPEEIDALPETRRPRYLALMVTPGSEAGAAWQTRYAPRLTKWGYHSRLESKFGGIYERNFR